MRNLPLLKKILHILVKLACAAVGVASIFLITQYEHNVYTAYEKIIVCGIFGGFTILYIAFLVSTILKRPVEPDLNSAWGVLGAAANLGAGVMCMLMFSEKTGSERYWGFVAGVIAFVNAACLLLDVIIMQIFP